MRLGLSGLDNAYKKRERGDSLSTLYLGSLNLPLPAFSKPEHLWLTQNPVPDTRSCLPCHMVALRIPHTKPRARFPTIPTTTSCGCPSLDTNRLVSKCVAACDQDAVLGAMMIHVAKTDQADHRRSDKVHRKDSLARSAKDRAFSSVVQFCSPEYLLVHGIGLGL